jgi:hydrogenase maturation protease
MPPGRAGVLVIGIGNPSRGDDAAGLLAARLARDRLAGAADISVLECNGDPVDLISRWVDADTVIIVDAARSGATPGRVHRIDARAGPLPTAIRRASSHALGVAEAVELARALHALPPRLIVYGIEAGAVSVGTPPSPAVASAAVAVARRVVRAARRYARAAAAVPDVPARIPSRS